MFLGPDLAAAHFIVHRNGIVKFVNNSKWYKREGSFEKYTLPGKKVEFILLHGA
jgi:hypothetical protein